VAGYALLVACKAAGALGGVPQLVDQSRQVHVTHKLVPTGPEHLAAAEQRTGKLSADLQNVAEWVVLLHPLLLQLLPADQGQVLEDMQERLMSRLRPAGQGSSSGSSSGDGGGGMAQQEAGGSSSTKGLLPGEVDAVLGTLQHVVFPGQPGCSYPRCCCLDGISEGEMKTQVCVACRGARYCSAACQRAHWRAGHKEVCKAVQAAVKAAAEV
jgi:hypothetical protein